MNITKIATVSLLPAAITGIGLSSVLAAQAAPGRAGVQVQLAGQHKDGKDHGHGKYHHWVRVRSGDNLSRIATRHHMSWRAVYATPPNFRHLASPDLVMIGQRVRIPANPERREAEFAVRYAALLRPAVVPTQPQYQAVNGQTGSVPGTQGQVPASGGAQTPAVTPSSPTAGMSSYQQCVAQRESGGNPAASSAGMYGILPSTWASLGYSGTAGQASVAQQNAAFQQLYATYGTQPWSPYDGC